MKKKIISILYSVLVAIFVIIFPVISGIIVTIYEINVPFTYYVQALSMIIPIIILFIMIYFNKIKKVDLYLNKTKDKKDYLYLLLVLIIFIPPLYKGIDIKDFKTIMGILLLYFFVGICEEFYFRGVITNLLSKNYTTFSLIIISSFIFGLGHLSSAFTGISLQITLLNVLNAVLFGLLAICLLIIIKSIYPLVFIHFLFDFETKIVSLTPNELFITEIIRGSLMSIICIYLIYKIYKNKISLEYKDN